MYSPKPDRHSGIIWSQTWVYPGQGEAGRAAVDSLAEGARFASAPIWAPGTQGWTEQTRHPVFMEWTFCDTRTGQASINRTLKGNIQREIHDWGEMKQEKRIGSASWENCNLNRVGGQVGAG